MVDLQEDANILTDTLMTLRNVSYAEEVDVIGSFHSTTDGGWLDDDGDDDERLFSEVNGCFTSWNCGIIRESKAFNNNKQWQC